MTIGASLFLIAAGAVLKFAVTTTISGIDLPTVGVILMVVGVLGLVLGLALLSRSRAVTRTRVVTERPVYDDPIDPRR
ncbi:hypothetical protein GCM10027047_39340 [Rhodococcus aerolatus]